MRNIHARRSFLAAAAAAAASSILPFSVKGGTVTTALSYVAASQPLLAICELLESAISGALQSSAQGKTLERISTQLLDLSVGQQRILGELVKQRIFFREEIRRAFLENDVRELVGLSQSFRVTLQRERTHDSATIRNLASRATALASKLGTYGLAGIPAYVVAIGLENSVNVALRAPADVFANTNAPHSTLLRSLLNPGEPGSIPQLIANYVPSEADKADQQQLEILFSVPYGFSVWRVVMSYKGIKDVIQERHTLEYWGFKDGNPILKPLISYCCGNPLRPPPGAQLLSGRVIEYDHFPRPDLGYDIPELVSLHGSNNSSSRSWPRDSYEPEVSGNQPVIRESTRIAEKTQHEAIARFYRRIYDPTLGDISSREAMPRRPLLGIRTLQQLDNTVRTAEGAIKRILAASNRLRP